MRVNTQWALQQWLGTYSNQILANPLGVSAVYTIAQNNMTFVGPGGPNICSLVIVIPPTTNTQEYQIKGAGGDIGLRCAAALPCAIGLNQTLGLTGIGIGLAAGVDQKFTVMWF